MPETQQRNLTLVEAIREAVIQEMTRDDSVFIMGEDIQIGGSFLFTLGLLDRFGPERIMDMPISESGFVGMAVGAAVQGRRPIVDFQYGDFVFEAMDQIIQQASKLRYMSGGQVQVPIVLQMPTGASGRGSQHANSVEGYFFHVPGLKVVTPSTPYDAKGLMISSIRDNNPVMFCVHKHNYGSKGRPLSKSGIATGHVPEEPYTLELGSADIKRKGEDITVVSALRMVHRSINAAAALEQDGIDAEVIDMRTLVPLDIETVIGSVRKTGRLVVVQEDNLRGGWGAEVVARVAEYASDCLKAPIRRIGAPDTPVPFSPTLESSIIPDEPRIASVIRSIVQTSGRST
jgi:pyruvate dehydrogenase E1 component beta subunit